MATHTTTQISPGTRAQTFTRHPHLIMRTPSTTQIRTAMEVLKSLGERINDSATCSAIRLQDMRLVIILLHRSKHQTASKTPVSRLSKRSLTAAGPVAARE